MTAVGFSDSSDPHDPERLLEDRNLSMGSAAKAVIGICHWQLSLAVVIGSVLI